MGEDPVPASEGKTVEDPRLAAIANVLRGYTGDCNCHEGYTCRQLIDPDCGYHLVPSEEAAKDIIEALDNMGKEPKEYAPVPVWNVFLYDPSSKYGDRVLAVHAHTVEEAEKTSLAQNPGCTIAHPTEKARG